MHSCIVFEMYLNLYTFKVYLNSQNSKFKGHRRTQSEKSSHSTQACCLYQLRACDAGHFIAYKQVFVCIHVVFSLSLFFFCMNAYDKHCWAPGASSNNSCFCFTSRTQQPPCFCKEIFMKADFCF